VSSLRKKSTKKKVKAVASAADKEIVLVPTNVKTGCICPNHGRPVDGMIFTDPCCKVHYSELAISAVIALPKAEVTEAELEEWRNRESTRKRVSYPKMTVARQ
jgi:hypothetical protein